MISSDKRQPTNTILITDPRLINKEDTEVLETLIETLQSRVSAKDERMTVTNLPFFKKCVLVFQNKATAQELYNELCDHEIKCSFAPRDTKFEFSSKDSVSPGINTDACPSPISDGESKESEVQEDSPFLKIPERNMELQSPPASPYLGFVPNQPEEAPDRLTITDPKSLSHILYQPTVDNLDKEKVFDHPSEENRRSHEIPILMLNRNAVEDLKKEALR